MVYIQNDKIASNVPSAWYSSLENYIVKGRNAEIWDSEGKRFLDYVGGYAVLNTGHLHPIVIEKVKTQLENFSHSLQERLMSKLPKRHQQSDNLLKVLN